MEVLIPDRKLGKLANSFPVACDVMTELMIFLLMPCIVDSLKWTALLIVANCDRELPILGGSIPMFTRWYLVRQTVSPLPPLPIDLSSVVTHLAGQPVPRQVA